MKNKYEVRGDVTAIFLVSPKYGEMETLISTGKLQLADKFPNLWQARFSKSTKSFYVQGKLPREIAINKTASFHRWITEDPTDMVIDHINHDTLDNTDHNLRIIGKGENIQNRKGAMINSKSGIRGVSWNRKTSKWRAKMTVGMKDIYLGVYENIEDAESAVKEARKLYMPYSQEALSS